MTLPELVEFVDNLNRIRVCNGLNIIAKRDKRNVVAITMQLNDGMVNVSTGQVVFMLDDPAITPDFIISRLKREFLACWDAVFTKAVTPGDFTNDGSPVMLVEEIDGSEVIRI